MAYVIFQGSTSYMKTQILSLLKTLILVSMPSIVTFRCFTLLWLQKPARLSSCEGQRASVRVRVVKISINVLSQESLHYIQYWAKITREGYRNCHLPMCETRSRRLCKIIEKVIIKRLSMDIMCVFFLWRYGIKRFFQILVHENNRIFANQYKNSIVGDFLVIRCHGLIGELINLTCTNYLLGEKIKSSESLAITIMWSLLSVCLKYRPFNN